MNLVIGKAFPNLELVDQDKKQLRLSEIAGNFPLIVVFYRGYW